MAVVIVLRGKGSLPVPVPCLEDLLGTGQRLIVVCLRRIFNMK